ncbi:MAG: hypothetical protein PHS42_02665 [Sulfurimonas sp.]|nr:hypothetical protein [Sulfurimonas sp.]
MRKQSNSKEFYAGLLTKKYKNSIELFIEDIVNGDTLFFECCREFAREILSVSVTWHWLNYRVDDFGINVEANIIKNIDKWISNQMQKNRFETLHSFIYWLFDRYVNTMKNLVDKRYRFSIQPTILLSNDYDEEALSEPDLDRFVALDEFLNYKESEKIKILKKVWDQNIFDLDFDIQDMEDLCVRYRAPPPQTFLSMNKEIETGVKQDENGRSQLVFIF